MSYSIVYSSETGNTKQLAETLRETLPQEGCRYFGTPAEAAAEADTLYVGFWTDRGHADADCNAFLKTLRGKKVFLFGTAGFGGSAEYFAKILSAVQAELDPAIPLWGPICVRAGCPSRCGSGTKR